MARIRKGTKMKDNAPIIVNENTVLNPKDNLPLTVLKVEPDPEMAEIEEAKKHFDDEFDAEAYWAGRLLADRKSTRIAA